MNEVKIVVTSKDKTDFASIAAKARTSMRESIKDGLDDVEKTTNERFREIGEESGRGLGEHAGASVKKPLNEGLEDVKKTTVDKFTEIGDQAGKSMGEHITDRVDVTVETKFREVGDRAGSSFGAGLKAKVSGIGGDIGPKFAGNLEKGAANAFQGIGAYGIAALVALVVAAAPGIGALLASGIVMAFGTGLAGLGLAATFHLKSVQKDLGQFKNFAKGWAREVSKPFEGVWKNLFNQAGQVMKVFQGPLKSAMSKFIAPALNRFIGNLAEAFTKLKPAVGPMSKAFADLMDAIGPQLPAIFESMSKALISMSETISANPDLFAGLITGIIQLIPLSLRLVNALAKVFNWLDSHRKGLEQAGKVFHGLASPIGFAAVAFGTLRDWAGKAWDQVSKFKNTKIGKIVLSASDKASGVVRSAIKTVGRFLGKTVRIGQHGAAGVVSAVGGAIRTVNRFVGKVVHVGQSGAASAMRAVQNLIAYIRRLAGKTVRVGANVFGLGSVRNLIGAIGGVVSKTVNIVARTFGFAHGGIVGGMATGGISHAAGGGPRSNTVLVGEQGPELVHLPAGSRVRSNPDTRAAMSANGGASTVVLELRSSGARIDDFLLELFRNAIRVRGGNVQVVLGK